MLVVLVLVLLLSLWLVCWLFGVWSECVACAVAISTFGLVWFGLVQGMVCAADGIDRLGGDSWKSSLS